MDGAPPVPVHSPSDCTPDIGMLWVLVELKEEIGRIEVSYSLVLSGGVP